MNCVFLWFGAYEDFDGGEVFDLGAEVAIIVRLGDRET